MYKKPTVKLLCEARDHTIVVLQKLTFIDKSTATPCSSNNRNRTASPTQKTTSTTSLSPDIVSTEVDTTRTSTASLKITTQSTTASVAIKTILDPNPYSSEAVRVIKTVLSIMPTFIITPPPRSTKVFLQRTK